MTPVSTRRHFLGANLAAGVSLALAHTHSVHAEREASKDLLTVGVMGTGGRGTSLATTFAQQPGVAVKYVCDVDRKRAESAAAAVHKAVKTSPEPIQEYQRILDDKSVDILVVATCNHWHAPAAILGCAHHKHVYVEKPCSHNPQEGEWMVQAAIKHKRKVQMGNQRRSWPKVIEAVTRVREGILGRAYLAQSWYWNLRGTIGRGKEQNPPDGLNYDLWQGPAPRKAFKSNYLHYNWHWFWHWGNGELGNNGVHMIDLCRWGLGVDFPIRVASAGGRYRFDDDQETPDTHVVSFEFADRKMIEWMGYSCAQAPGGRSHDVVFHGEKGSLAINGNGYTLFDPKGKEVNVVSGGSSPDAIHIGNFLTGIRKDAPLNSEIGEAHKSTLLCHLGNIAHRTGRTLKCEPKAGHILDDKDAASFWRREYAPGWESKLS